LPKLLIIRDQYRSEQSHVMQARQMIAVRSLTWTESGPKSYLTEGCLGREMIFRFKKHRRFCWAVKLTSKYMSQKLTFNISGQR
jgi:hypothetical protein